MNLSLTDPFVSPKTTPNLPPDPYAAATRPACASTAKGDFLAAGRVDGTVVIFDVETNGVATKTLRDILGKCRV